MFRIEVLPLFQGYDSRRGPEWKNAPNALFHDFGSIGNVHVLDKSIKCVLLGVSEESKAYKLYEPNTKKEMTNRYVVFAKDAKWNWKKQLEEGNNELIDSGDREYEEMEFF